jgi:hypothetical protein
MTERFAARCKQPWANILPYCRRLVNTRELKYDAHNPELCAVHGWVRRNLRSHSKKALFVLFSDVQQSEYENASEQWP